MLVLLWQMAKVAKVE